MRFLTSKARITIHLFKRAAGKSPRVLFVRGLQEMRLLAMRVCGKWPRIARQAEKLWTSGRCLDVYQAQKYSIFHPNAVDALQNYAASGQEEHVSFTTALQTLSQNIQNRDFQILNAPVPESGAWPWNRDWRYDHAWAPAYFKTYTHHEDRAQPYDVKYPWEVSRLSFLPPMIQAGFLSASATDLKTVFMATDDILSDWAQKNPLAYSINWYPMEVAMRSLSLLQIFDMCLAAPEDIARPHLPLVLQLLTTHGAFLWRTIEDTDNRGNHYTANIVALLGLGIALEDHYRPARKWKKYALQNLDKEVLAQFTPDGVNFEMSTGYHRLVTELFLTAQIMLQRRAHSLSDAALTRLEQACLYAASYIRPDGYAPMIGDCDDATVFALDTATHRDHSILLSLGALLFQSPALQSAFHRTKSQIPPAPFWLFAEKALSLKDQTADAKQTTPPVRGYFENAGIVIARHQDNYMFMDIGDVGQNGLGGHGHNDILSFELFLKNIPLVIDPGCYIYSGDKKARDHFRSTASHNTLMIDAHESSRFNGPFRLHNDAQPCDIDVTQEENIWKITAGHKGYMRLSAPVAMTRQIVFDAAQGLLTCQDTITTTAPCHVTRFLHFSPDIAPHMQGNAALILQHNRDDTVFALDYDSRSDMTLTKTQVSFGYGQCQDAPGLTLSTALKAGKTELSFSIRIAE